MITVALLGLDGAGKTSISQKLQNEFPIPVKYMYMSYHIPSSNIALPTSRFAYFLKWQLFKLKNENKEIPRELPVHEAEYRRGKRGQLRTVARVLNRMSEECYRQVVSWIYQKKGHIVLYDRHFLFQDALATGDIKNRKMADKFHAWFLENIYPRPDLCIFLDATPDILYQRKKEGSVEYLAARRNKYLEQGKRVNNFEIINAVQSLEKVYNDVTKHIFRCYEQKKSKKEKTI